ncbi:MAG: ribose 5-phosphate isomerase A [Piscirickettsiaceae bacterium]|nr:MAG: ribose 5-phosphate isomerase A [Piscirickettsiaceae bacterium]
MSNNLKLQAAKAAIEYIHNVDIIGVGTGSTVNYFINLLEPLKHTLKGAVSSSKASTKKLQSLGIPVLDLNSVDAIEVYVDGADETNAYLQLIKGGGGALTREKILAAVSKKFVCIADESKLVSCLGTFPLPIEVIPMARSYVAREIVKLGGHPEWRDSFITDNGNIILDIHRLDIMEPMKLESTLNNLTGVVTTGLFANRPADVVLLAGAGGIKTLTL